jgi:hypothetical protein
MQGVKAGAGHNALVFVDANYSRVASRHDRNRESLAPEFDQDLHLTIQVIYAANVETERISPIDLVTVIRNDGAPFTARSAVVPPPPCSRINRAETFQMWYTNTH